MTYGKLKINVLKLIENDGEEISEENIVSLEEQENYRPYLLAFNEAFNRGLSRIVVEKKMPLKRLEMSLNTMITDYEITNNEDIYEISAIIFKDTQNQNVDINYRIISNQYLELEEAFNGKAVIYYHRRLGDIEDDNTLELKTIGINDFLANALQFYIKADLYESDDAAKAQYALNRFESYLGQIQEDTIVSMQSDVFNWI